MRRAEADAQQVRQTIRQQVWDAASRLVESREALRATAAMVTSADESVRAMRERYRAGAATISELLDAAAAQARATASHVQAIWNQRAAAAAWHWASGQMAG